MPAKKTTLRYDGAGSLTFHDGAGARRTVTKGQVFEVDEATAETLLSTGSEVTTVAPSKKGGAQVNDDNPTQAPLPAGATPDPNAPPMTEASPDVTSSEADPLAAAPPEGGTLPEPGPTQPASAAEENQGETGPVTLDSLPDSAKKGGSKSSSKS